MNKEDTRKVAQVDQIMQEMREAVTTEEVIQGADLMRAFVLVQYLGGKKRTDKVALDLKLAQLEFFIALFDNEVAARLRLADGSEA